MTQSVAKENITINNNKPNIPQLINKFVNSYWALLAITLIVAGFWAVNLPVISATCIVIFEILVFVFSPENPKAFLYPIIAIFFAIKTGINTLTLIYAGVLVAIFLETLLPNIVIKIKKEKFVCRKGKMFWFFIPLIIANFLGGVIGHFNIVTSLIASVLLIIIYGAYWFCLNFVKNAQRYYAYCAIFLSFLIALEIFINYFFISNGFFWGITHKVSYFGLMNINCASIIMLTGLCSCFYLAKGSKKDYLYLLLAVLLDIIILQNYSRIAIFCAVLISIIYFIIVVRKSSNKKPILITLAVCCVVALIVAGVMWKQIYKLLQPYINLKFKLNGRHSLWNWCIEQFKNNPIFGIGFSTTDPYVLAGNTPGMDIQGTFAYVHTHNFFLHHLTCIGIIGLLLSIPFYVQKYRILFKKLSTYKTYIIIMFLSLFVTSLFDPTYTSDFFLVFFCMVVFAVAENITYNYEDDEIDKQLVQVTNQNTIVNSRVEEQELKDVNTVENINTIDSSNDANVINNSKDANTTYNSKDINKKDEENKEQNTKEGLTPKKSVKPKTQTHTSNATRNPKQKKDTETKQSTKKTEPKQKIKNNG